MVQPSVDVVEALLDHGEAGLDREPLAPVGSAHSRQPAADRCQERAHDRPPVLHRHRHRHVHLTLDPGVRHDLELVESLAQREHLAVVAVPQLQADRVGAVEQRDAVETDPQRASPGQCGEGRLEGVGARREHDLAADVADLDRQDGVVDRFVARVAGDQLDRSAGEDRRLPGVAA